MGTPIRRTRLVRALLVAGHRRSCELQRGSDAGERRSQVCTDGRHGRDQEWMTVNLVRC